MSTERYEQNFGTCALRDSRLNRRALSIGQALSENLAKVYRVCLKAQKT